MPYISISSSHGDKEARYLIQVLKILPKIKKLIDRDINKIKFKNIVKPIESIINEKYYSSRFKRTYRKSFN